MILRARLVLPVAQPPIENGAVGIARSRIEYVGSWAAARKRAGRKVLDLGEVILMPGLVNAHCHLDYTDLAGQILPTRLFTDWIKSVTAAKAAWSHAEFAASWLRGAQMLVRSGTTTVADIEAAPELLPEAWHSTPLRVFSFLEMTGIKSRRHPRLILEEAVGQIVSLPKARGGVGLSPHAPYSTTPQLMELTARTARRRSWRTATHVAESATEFEMFVHGRGEMFEWLRRNERDMSDCGQGSPVQHLDRCGLLAANLLAAHANYLAEGDADLLARRGVSVVHCPRSHAYFRHARFPCEELTAAGVNVCLGTDSLATVLQPRTRDLELNLFAEMRAFSASYPQVSPATVVRMATLHPAKALGLKGRIGQISPGVLADLIAIPGAGEASAAYESVVNHRRALHGSLIHGRWAIHPPT